MNNTRRFRLSPAIAYHALLILRYHRAIVNDSLDHLPPEYRADLARLVEMIRNEVDDVHLIILYGSFARGDWKTEADLPPPDERWSGHPSDYDILVITDRPDTGGDAARWDELSERTLDMGLKTHARIIGYDFHTFIARLKETRYFYVDIYDEGRILFQTGKRTLTRPQPLPKAERKKLAQEYFEEGIKRAAMFFEVFNDTFARGSADSDYFKIAAFNLHQAAEVAYKTVMLVFANRKPKGHWLKLLCKHAGGHAPSVRDVFPMETQAERDRFKQLDKAYIGARYELKYTISKEDLELLAPHVRELIDRTKAACEAALEQMG